MTFEKTKNLKKKKSANIMSHTKYMCKLFYIEVKKKVN